MRVTEEDKSENDLIISVQNYMKDISFLTKTFAIYYCVTHFPFNSIVNEFSTVTPQATPSNGLITEERKLNKKLFSKTLQSANHYFAFIID